MPSISPTSQGGEQIVGTASALASSSQSIQSRNAILVSHNQKGNPLLKHIRNMRWAFADVVCGDLLGQNSCALYLRVYFWGMLPFFIHKSMCLGVVLKVYVSMGPMDMCFAALSHVMDASMEDMARCPGIEECKVKCLYDTFHKPFKRVVSSHPPIPKTPFLKDVEPSSVNEVTEVEKDTKERKQM
ncbi:DNA excision repair protein ERCC-1 [Citrus sinensis]|uniref:DNA excision repair protein ERCC-1 n=1 Tax=Citrus sinensis TaxID=2711 RepID=A0ACB8KKK7_CITSI|nr:DNA excision repair protein ERCC-1 [Citrus sinensis]